MSDLYRLLCENPAFHMDADQTTWHNQRCYVKIETTDSIKWCFTCGHKPYTDGLGYEHEKDSGCKGQSHDIGTFARVDMKDTT